MTQQFPAMVGEQNTLPLPVKEHAAQVLLQGADGVADGGLRQMQGPPRLGKAALTGEDGEGTKLTRIEEWGIHL